jgi:integrase
MEDYKLYLKNQRKKNGEKFIDSSIERYVYYLEPYRKTIDSIPSVEEKIEYMNSILKNRRSLPLYSSFLHYLFFTGCDSDDPTGIHKKLKYPKRNANAFSSSRFMDNEILSEKQMKMLFENTKDLTMKCLISFIYDTGCRRNEVMNVKFRDMTFMKSKNIEMVSKGIFAEVQVTGKGNKKRVVWLHRTTVELIIQLHGKKLDANAKIFVLYKDVIKTKPYAYQDDALYKKFVKLCEKILGEHHRVHSLRHTRLTHLADEGMGALQLQSYAGHEKIETTMVYIHRSKNRALKGIKEHSRDIFGVQT